MLGETIDYGPFGWMDAYDPNYTPNHSDAAGRYRYSAQPEMAEWGLRRLAEALRPFLPEAAAEEALARFTPLVRSEWLSTFRRKLGLLLLEEEGDEELIEGMLATMQRSGADFTNTFRSLSRIDPPTTDEGCVVRPQTFDPVLEYILAQSASLEAMRKKSVAAFHPQARCSPLPNLPTSHTSHSSEPHSPATPTTTTRSLPAHHPPPSPHPRRRSSSCSASRRRTRPNSRRTGWTRPSSSAR